MINNLELRFGKDISGMLFNLAKNDSLKTEFESVKPAKRIL